MEIEQEEAQQETTKPEMQRGWLLSFITKRQVPLAATSACIWAVFHSLFAAAWGLVIIWPFFVFSCSYINWRKQSFRRAILITTCIHSLQNLVPGIVVFAQSIRKA